MKLFNKVAIVGVGLIGGSVGLAIKKKRLAGEVIGISRHRETLSKALKVGAIDRGSQDLNIIKDVDSVILATPVSIVQSLAGKISKIIRADCMVSDVASTKKEIVSKLEKLFPNYIGSHPLAGSEKRGIINANALMFEGSLCILTPTKNTKYEVKFKIKRLWNKLGTKVVFLAPGTHDKILSFVSHLPHIVSFSLIESIPKKYLKFSSTSLKDTTRIAASDARLWLDIFLSNQKNTLKAIKFFQENLSKIKSAIQRKDKRLLVRILKEAKQKREILE